MLKGKTAVVTGASTGIGKAIALKMAENGASIAIIYIGDANPAQDVKKAIENYGVRAEIYECDVSDFEASKTICEKIIEDFGSVNILVNNAGIIRDNLLLRMSESDFDSVINVNLKGVFNITKHLSRSIMRAEEGRIINIASVSGIMGNAGQANYSAAKAGVIGLTKTTAKEFAGKNVTCNAIAPGFVETDMTANLPQAVKDSANSTIPLKRMGTPDEIANVAVFLASDMASYITGEVIKVDGGMCI
ncbi:MAG: 3-oxoacyl-[acyl-carrier-protein] reductase [Oscillospiraceae bacterium]|nr:3-oxoacyl-[acyl-carrier-protein] reductase [Oscillospiraceae bacterium]